MRKSIKLAAQPNFAPLILQITYCNLQWRIPHEILSKVKMSLRLNTIFIVFLDTQTEIFAKKWLQL